MYYVYLCGRINNYVGFFKIYTFLKSSLLYNMYITVEKKKIRLLLICLKGLGEDQVDDNDDNVSELSALSDFSMEAKWTQTSIGDFDNYLLLYLHIYVYRKLC